jgi:hypothetical protein
MDYLDMYAGMVALSLLGTGFFELFSFLEKNSVPENIYGTERDSAVNWHGSVLQQKGGRQYFDGRPTRSCLCF